MGDEQHAYARPGRSMCIRSESDWATRTGQTEPRAPSAARLTACWTAQPPPGLERAGRAAVAKMRPPLQIAKADASAVLVLAEAVLDAVAQLLEHSRVHVCHGTTPFGTRLSDSILRNAGSRKRHARQARGAASMSFDASQQVFSELQDVATSCQLSACLQKPRPTHPWQRNEKGLDARRQVALRAQEAIHLPALLKLLESVVELTGHDDLQVLGREQGWRPAGTTRRYAAC